MFNSAKIKRLKNRIDKLESLVDDIKYALFVSERMQSNCQKTKHFSLDNVGFFNPSDLIQQHKRLLSFLNLEEVTEPSKTFLRKTSK